MDFKQLTWCNYNRVLPVMMENQMVNIPNVKSTTSTQEDINGIYCAVQGTGSPTRDKVLCRWRFKNEVASLSVNLYIIGNDLTLAMTIIGQTIL